MLEYFEITTHTVFDGLGVGLLERITVKVYFFKYLHGHEEKTHSFLEFYFI